MFTSTVVLGLWDQNHELAVQVFYRLTDDLSDVKKAGERNTGRRRWRWNNVSRSWEEERRFWGDWGWFWPPSYWWWCAHQPQHQPPTPPPPATGGEPLTVFLTYCQVDFSKAIFPMCKKQLFWRGCLPWQNKNCKDYWWHWKLQLFPKTLKASFKFCMNLQLLRFLKPPFW